MAVRRRAVTAGGQLLFTSALAGAQIDSVLPGSQPIDMASITLNQTLLRGVLDRKLGTGASGSMPAAGYLVYRPSRSVTERVKRGYLSRSEKAYDPKVAADLRQLLAMNDFVRLGARNEASDGLRPNDLGDSVAAYWTMHRMAANCVPSTSRAQIQALRPQIGPVIARNPAIRCMSDAQKQEFSGRLMLDYVVTAIGVNAAQKAHDPFLAGWTRQGAVTRFKQAFRVDLATVKLTKRGLVKARTRFSAR